MPNRCIVKLATGTADAPDGTATTAADDVATGIDTTSTATADVAVVVPPSARARELDAMQQLLARKTSEYTAVLERLTTAEDLCAAQTASAQEALAQVRLQRRAGRV